MSQNRRRWTVGGLALLVPLGLVSVQAWSQRQAENPMRDTVQEPHAKRMAELIKEGQLNLRDATQIAEKHVKGVALQVNCVLQPAGVERAPAGTERGTRDQPLEEQKDRSAGDRLVYSVSCFADERLQTVRVDGQTKRVIDNLGQPGS